LFLPFSLNFLTRSGTGEFLKACQSYYHKIGFDFIDQADIIIGEGASETLAWAFYACCELGDEVLTFEPFYSNYSAIAAFTGITIVCLASE
jgi:aspartate aminotransferase